VHRTCSAVHMRTKGVPSGDGRAGKHSASNLFGGTQANQGHFVVRRARAVINKGVSSAAKPCTRPYGAVHCCT